MKVIIKQGKEKPLVSRHHWVFSGAVLRTEGDPVNGSILEVCDYNNKTLGYGYYNKQSQIIVRMLAFGSQVFSIDGLRLLIANAIAKRTGNPTLQQCTAKRLIYAEADLLPGLIVDQYNEHLVIQILTLGMDCLKQDIVHILQDILAPLSIYERSDHEGRKLEGLEKVSCQVYGHTPDEIEITENGVRFLVDVKNGQKTGFFIDQRDNRRLVMDYAKDKRVLNLFSYTGGFSVAALKGGAHSVISVDASHSALDMTAKNIALQFNNIDHSEICTDVFSYIRNTAITADLIIIDPPSFTKKRGDMDSAARGYKELNLQVLKKCPQQSLILTCSCSRHVSVDLFQKIIFGALKDSGRNGCIALKTGHAADHPINIYHPESEYLKAFLLYID